MMVTGKWNRRKRSHHYFWAKRDSRSQKRGRTISERSDELRPGQCALSLLVTTGNRSTTNQCHKPTVRLLADTTCIAHPAVNFHIWLCLTLGRKAIHEVADL